MRRPTVLLTGATGAVGADLLQRLARRGDLAVKLLVRRSDRDPVERVRALLDYAEINATIDVIEGDVCAGRGLGASPDALRDLQHTTTHLIHCAGSTSFTLPITAARRANVDGSRNVLDFARDCPALECGAFLSTVYVSGKRCGDFAESDFGDGGLGFVNSYEESKAEMEEMISAAMSELPLILVRLSTVIGDSGTGRVRHFNTIHHAVRLLYSGLAPMIPGDPNEPVDIVSSDFVAEAVLRLVEHAPRPGVYHVAAGRESSSSLGDIIDETMSAIAVHRPQWRKRTIEKPLIVDLDTYELFVKSVEETGNPVLREATRSIRTFAYQLAHPKVFDTDRATAALADDGIAPQQSLDFYPRVVKYCLESNWGTRQC
ncbi:MAG TPA: SDR family oxidoreductase [Gemmatimonadaceae bacterium]|jgi:nucleoside-diphosphate-sugar epimerase|nr:SDR family oxidoreductase [Gemmatimonadaceae bacterium]